MSFQNDNTATPLPEVKILDCLNSGNVLTQKGLLGHMKVDKANGKFFILYCLLALSTQEVLDEFALASGQPRPNIEDLKKKLKDIKEKSSFSVFTLPPQPMRNINDAKRIAYNQLVENHFIATLSAIITGSFPSEETKNMERDVKTLPVPNIAPLEEVESEAEGGRPTYFHTESVKKIVDYITKLYPNDELVEEVVSAIESKNQDIINFLKTKIIALLSSKMEKKEKKINNTKIIEETVTCSIDGTFEGARQSFIGKIVIGGIELRRTDIHQQTSYTLLGTRQQINNEDAKITYFRVFSIKEGVYKRYYVNGDTGYMIETPDIDFEQLDENTPIRIWNGQRWYDKFDNAVCAKYSYIDNTTNSLTKEGIIFSFYDEKKKQCVHCSPFSSSLSISDYSNIKNEYYSYKDGVRSFNLKLDEKIENMESGSLEKLDDADMKSKKTKLFSPRSNPLFLCGSANEIEILKMMRRYGPYNMLSPDRPTNERNKYDLKQLSKFYEKAIKGKGITDDFTSAVSAYNFKVDNDKDYLKRNKLQKSIAIEFMLTNTRPKSISIEKYSNGKKVEVKLSDEGTLTKSFIKDGVGLYNIGTTNAVNTCLAKKIKDMADRANVQNLDFEKEYDSTNISVSDLSARVYEEVEKYEIKKKQKEEEEQNIGRDKNKKKSIEPSSANNDEAYEGIAIINVNKACSSMQNIKEKSFFEKILIFFGIIKDTKKRIVEEAINTVRRNMPFIKNLTPKQIGQIQEICDIASRKTGSIGINISNCMPTYSLNETRRGKSKRK